MHTRYIHADIIVNSGAENRAKNPRACDAVQK